MKRLFFALLFACFALGAWAASVTVGALGTSLPLPAGPGSKVTLFPTGGTARVEYTTGSLSDIGNNVATWSTWPNGTVSTSSNDISAFQMFVRAVGVTGSAVLTVDAADPSSIWYRSTIPWASSQGGGSGTPGGSNTQVQFNNSNAFGGSANLTWISPALSIGASGSTGQLKLLGTTSGTATVTPQAVAGTPTITLPNASGTVAVSATAPIALDSNTGALTWTGATITGTPAAGDLSYWTGANTEALVLNSSGASGRVLTWAANAAPTWTAPAGGGGALSAITAATVANTIANGDFLQTWQAAKTTDSSGFFRITESAASTGGTSTANVPNQYLVKLDTVAASTASPLTLYSRGSHVASVSPSNPQIFLTDGTAANPVLAFASQAGTGMWLNGPSDWRFYVNGSPILQLTGSVRASNLTDLTTGHVVIDWPVDHVMRITDNIDGEWIRWGSFFEQPSRGSADATAFAINARKSRGTVAAPTVITTGDALFTESGFGYVGATNTYKEATRIEFDSTGTIADTTTGIGGTIKLQTTKAGTDTAPQTNLTITGGSTGSVTVAVGTTLNPATVAGIVGTTAADNAQAGSVGEVQSCTLATGSSVTLTTNTTANICTINTLPAGDWDCTGVVDFTFGATTSYTNLTGGISTTSATLGGQDTKFDYETAANVPTAGADAAWVIPTVRENIGSATQVWLVAQATFTVSTLKAYGTLRCRRMR